MSVRKSKPGCRAGDRLRDVAGDRLAGLDCAALVGGASQQSGKCRSAADHLDVFRRRSVNPAVLPSGTVLRCKTQLHGGRYLALLDHPLVARGLLRVLRHHDRGARPMVSPAATPRCK